MLKRIHFYFYFHIFICFFLPAVVKVLRFKNKKKAKIKFLEWQ